MLNRFRLVLTAAVTLLCAIGVFAQEQGSNSQSKADEDFTFFEEKIRPVLIEHCLDCHSVDSEASGGLVLDSEEGWKTGGDSGPAIVEGSAKESLLFEAISYTNPNLEMPPEGVLPPEAIRNFQRWIDEGAADPRRSSNALSKKQTGLPVERASEHWAYRPIEAPDLAHLPKPIDHLIDAKLDKLDYEVAPSASEAAQVRRLYFDLTGLPPTSNDLDRFLTSSSSSKYEDLVDELLASPRYGEHIARKWMDVARYAESITLRGFVLPEAWRYRDYLIRSFNADRPFDQMIREQLAGDLIAAKSTEAKHDPLIATAFLAMGNTNLERQDKSQLEMDYVDEQLQTVGRAFLGQTIGCARCHDHKFDPIPTSDYYALAGIFKSATAMRHDNVSKWIEQPLPRSRNDSEQYDEIANRLAKVVSEKKEAEKKLNRIEQAEKALAYEGIVVDGDRAVLKGAWRNSTSVSGYIGKGYLVGDSGSAEFKPSDLEPGTYEVRFAYTPFNNRSTKTRVMIEHDQGESEIRVDQTQSPRLTSPFLSLGEFRFEKTSACVKVLAADADGAVIADAVQFIPKGIEARLPVSSDESELRTRIAEKSQLTKQIAKLADQEKSLQKQRDAWPKYLTVVEENPPEDIAICIRGDFHNQGEVVSRGFLTAVEPRGYSIPSDESGREQFAYWVTDPANPLAARVYVNRIWLWIMGQGIVDSPNNFGTTGMSPTHPELLDWLAAELIKNQWSTKRLVKLIVMSDAYKRSADYSPAPMAENDPRNTLYWRGHSRKLGVEALRDAMLQISGELDLTMEGSLLKPNLKSDYNYKHNSTRRSVYHPVLRNSLPELFEVFDFADSSMSTGKRPRTTVAPQELALMNHPWVAERVKHTTERYWSQFDLKDNWIQSELHGVVTQLYIDCLGREPSLAELEAACDFLAGASAKEGKDASSGVRKLALQQLVHCLFVTIDFRYLD